MKANKDRTIVFLLFLLLPSMFFAQTCDVELHLKKYQMDLYRFPLDFETEQSITQFADSIHTIEGVDYYYFHFPVVSMTASFHDCPEDGSSGAVNSTGIKYFKPSKARVNCKMDCTKMKKEIMLVFNNHLDGCQEIYCLSKKKMSNKNVYLVKEHYFAPIGGD